MYLLSQLHLVKCSFFFLHLEKPQGFWEDAAGHVFWTEMNWYLFILSFLSKRVLLGTWHSGCVKNIVCLVMLANRNNQKRKEIDGGLNRTAECDRVKGKGLTGRLQGEVGGGDLSEKGGHIVQVLLLICMCGWVCGVTGPCLSSHPDWALWGACGSAPHALRSCD